LKTQIKLSTADEVRDFVDQASKCDFDIDIFYNRFIIDAKSLLGVLSMDLTQNLNVNYSGYDAAFEQTLTKYAIA